MHSNPAVRACPWLPEGGRSTTAQTQKQDQDKANLFEPSRHHLQCMKPCRNSARVSCAIGRKVEVQSPVGSLVTPAGSRMAAQRNVAEGC